ncbi:hypothetical protein TNCT_619211 [Trichonephila clavata]|uniref:Uncharacterized protein n=1 Tax=Trichonephila clavata TaxID=2740835 RepID=A0A8X6LZK5_TRICU|nr:hypothetical protein TNCT_619211 [Trichonephila clavata]
MIDSYEFRFSPLRCYGSAICMKGIIELCTRISKGQKTAVATNGSQLYDPGSQGTRTCPSPVEISPSISRKVESGTRDSPDD